MVENEPQNPITRRSYYIDSAVGKFPVIEVSPAQLKTNISVVIVPGWSESPGVFDLSQLVMANEGRRSFSFDHPRIGGKVEKNPDYPTPELRKALALLDLIDNSGSNKVDIVAHSEGAIYTVIAASLEPEKFRNIVLVGPGGMIGQDTLITLLGRFSKKVARNLFQGITDRKTTRKVVRAHTGAAKYIVKNPLRALKEAFAISKSNIHEMLPQLRSKGIGIVIIHHADDEAFPMHRIQGAAKKKVLEIASITSPEVAEEDIDIVGLMDEFLMDGILAVTGLHDDLYMRPEEYTALGEEMLTRLERKQAKKNKLRNTLN